ncbi:MAG TPA: oxygen-independent coproporphyrinogen III oxidase [Bacteroidia bacterium]
MSLVSKYNIPAPRYTSYPTVPYWDSNLDEENWKANIRNAFRVNNKDGISIYIHLPYCESLCTYCACNTRITINHKVEIPYITAVLSEWKLYLKEFGKTPKIKEIHLGGGTPTFFSPENLGFLISSLLKDAEISDHHDFSFEGHPANTTEEHLKTLYELGFRRVSFGVQDFDPVVQNAINRFQSFEEVKGVMDVARKIGYTSINIDLVYGLPHQTKSSVQETIEQIVKLKPERIAFYSYAHVPWIKPGQRKYNEKDLPDDDYKRNLYETGKSIFLHEGYRNIGMDHFALKHDNLSLAFDNGTLHRNFMGYTDSINKLLVGLGCSSISDTWTAFSQNIKTVEEYVQAVNSGKFPIMKGHILTVEDLMIRQHILDLMCRHKTNFGSSPSDLDILMQSEARLSELIQDKLISLNETEVNLTTLGINYLRNICLAFDKRYWNNLSRSNKFSKTA